MIRDASGFQGHACSGDLASAAWCGSSAQYIQKLALTKAQGTDLLNNGSTLLLSTVAARRLTEMMSAEDFDGQPLVGEFDMEPLTTSLDDFSSSATVIGSQVADVGAHVIYTVLSESAVAIWNIFQTLITGVSAALLWVVRSGVLRSVVQLGVDFLLVLLLKIALPLLMAVLDVVFCLLDYAMPGGWPAQLACVKAQCFDDASNLGADIWATFSSVPIVGAAVSDAVTSLFNGVSGVKYTDAASGASDLPDIDDGDLGTAAGAQCAACFNCKV